MKKTFKDRMLMGATAGFALLGACTGSDFTSGGNASFSSSYAQARKALEAGNFEIAAARFEAMLESAGPLETRLRLERSHALLRANQYAAAAQEARVVAASHSDKRRAAALAVVGTAEHRMAQESMSQGDFGTANIEHLTRARSALKEMLASAPELDPLGAMSQRLTMVETSLKNLGG